MMAAHRLLEAEVAFLGEAVGVAGPYLDAAAGGLLVRFWLINALDHRVRVKERLEGLRLPGVGWNAFDAKAQLEREVARLRIYSRRPGEEVRPSAVQVNPPGVRNGVVTQAGIREENKVAMRWEGGDFHVLPRNEQLVVHLCPDLLAAREAAFLRADYSCDGGAGAVLFLLRRNGRVVRHAGNDTIRAAAWVAFWEVAHRRHGVERGEVGCGGRWWRWWWRGVLLGWWGCFAVACAVAGIEAEEAARWVAAVGNKVVRCKAL